MLLFKSYGDLTENIYIFKRKKYAHYRKYVYVCSYYIYILFKVGENLDLNSRIILSCVLFFPFCFPPNIFWIIFNWLLHSGVVVSVLTCQSGSPWFSFALGLTFLGTATLGSIQTPKFGYLQFSLEKQRQWRQVLASPTPNAVVARNVMTLTLCTPLQHVKCYGT